MKAAQVQTGRLLISAARHHEETCKCKNNLSRDEGSKGYYARPSLGSIRKGLVAACDKEATHYWCASSISIRMYYLKGESQKSRMR